MTACHGAKGTGTLYSYAQLEGLWINAGGPRTVAPVAAAIAMAESGGCTTAYNSSGASGLWQILGLPANWKGSTDYFNAATNASMAVAKYKQAGNTFKPWTTYGNGQCPGNAYCAFVKGSTTPITTDLPGPGQSPQPSTSGTTANTADCLISLPSVDLGIGHLGGGCAVSKSEGRVVIGAMLMVAGGSILALGAIFLAAFGLKTAPGGKTAGGLLEAGGGVLAVAGFPEAGIPVSAAGAAVRSRGSARAAAQSGARAARKNSAPRPAPRPRPEPEQRASSPSEQT